MRRLRTRNTKQSCWSETSFVNNLSAHTFYNQAHDAFEKFDVDHSGCIDAWELKEAMKSLGQASRVSSRS